MTQLTNQIAVRNAAPRSIAGLLNPAAGWRNLWSHRDLIRQFTVREVEAKYRGSNLGLLWAVLRPLMSLAVFGFVFIAVLKVRWPIGDESPAAYLVTIFTGMAVFSAFSETVTNAPTMVLSRANLVKRTMFPLEVLPLTSLGANLFVMFISCGLVVLAWLVLGGSVSWTALLLPVAVLPLVLITLGLSWFLASLGVFLRDIRELVVVLAGQVLYFMTPIFYPIESVPETYRWLLYWNPMTPIVEDARRVLLWGRLPDWPAWGAVTLLGLVSCVLGYAWFMKSRRGFSDVL